MPSSLFLMLFLACGEKSSDTSSEDSENSENTDDTDTNDTDDTNSEEESNPVKPVISNADAWCYTVGGSTEGDQWAFEFTMDDPQGIETINRLQDGAISIKSSSGVVTSVQTAACSWDTGACSARIFTTQVGVGCDSADVTTVDYQIIDEDENLSDVVSVTGRYEETVE